MIDKQLIENKAVAISRYIEEIEPLLKFSNEEIKNDGTRLHASERLIQLIVDAAIDINTHIIAEKKLEVPDDYHGTFEELFRGKILTHELAKKIAPSVGLRNRIIHQYEKVDLDLMLSSAKKGITDYVEYLKQIKNFIDKN